MFCTQNIHMYIYIYMSMQVNGNIHMYIYIYMSMQVNGNIHMYIYIYMSMQSMEHIGFVENYILVGSFIVVVVAEWLACSPIT